MYQPNVRFFYFFCFIMGVGAIFVRNRFLPESKRSQNKQANQAENSLPFWRQWLAEGN